MKQLLQKSMATRSLSLLVAFFMMVAVQGMAQKNNSSGGSSAGSGADLAVSKLVLPVKKLMKVPLESSGQKILTRNGEGNILKITSNGTDKEYADWKTAMEALKSGDKITLLSKVTLYEAAGDKMPDKPCTIDGGDNTLEFNTNGFAGDCDLQGNITFKSVHLDAGAIVANGKTLVFDSGVTVNNNCDVYGGGGLGMDVENTSITIKDGVTLNIIYGGGYVGKVTGNTNIVVDGGTVTAIFGGGYNADAVVEGSTNIVINNATSISTVYGGGYNAPVKGTANIKIENGNVDYIIGGGGNASAICKNTNIEIKGGTFGQDNNKYRYNVMGGGYSAPIEEKAKVTISGGTFNCFVNGGGGFDNETTATCGSTELNITGGTFINWTYGGGWASPVLGTATMKVNIKVKDAGQLTTLCGGGARPTASCGNTDVSISAGNLSYINGGGENGNVIGECHLAISGTPTISGNVFGGSNSLGTTVGSTRVEISGGTFQSSIFGGGWGCDVLGDTHVSVTGGSIEYSVFGGGSQGQVLGSTNVVIDGGTVGGVFGGGYGEFKVFNDKGSVGNTEVLVRNALAGTDVFGGGLYGNVTGNTSVTIEGGSFSSVYGSSYIESNNQTLVGGNVNILIKGGEMEHVGMARDQLMGKAVPVSGSMNLTIEGGRVTKQISSGNHPDGEGYKPCTLTIRNLGNDTKPYSLPKVYAISNLVLEGSVVDVLSDPTNNVVLGYVVEKNNPLTITGNGKLVGANILLNNFSDIGANFPLDVPLVIADALPKTTTFTVLDKRENNVVKTFTVYKAGNTYRMTKTPDGLKTVAIASPVNGTFSVTWKEATRDTELESGDQVPLNTELTLSAIPDEGYRFIEYQNHEVKITDNPYQITADVAFSALFEAIPYQVTITSVPNGSITASPNTDVTIGTEVALTITPASGYRLKSGSLKVYKTGNESTTVNVINNTFSMPAYDVTVAAEFEEIPAPPTPPAPVYHTVTLPAVEGASTDPIAGDHEVESWDNFLFFLTLDKAYDQSEPVVTTDRGETITPRAKDGAYIIKYVRQPIVIKIDGIVKNPDPTANAEIQSGIKVWQNNHQLFIHTDKVEQVAIYTFGGQLKKKFRSTGGDELVQLPAGSYIVCIGDQRFKVVL